jgi:predicted nuclease of predicted toxin-antitoxin system
VKVLIDENLHHRLRKHLGGHDVLTVAYKGWAGLKNGELLRTAEADGFDVFVTGDATLVQEQNLTGRRWRLWRSQPTTGPSSSTICRRLPLR